MVQHYSASLPSTDQLNNYNPAVVTRLYSADGKLMAEYAKEKRFFLPLSAIPKQVQQAFLSAEDKNFYSHQGVDLWGTARAMRANILNYGQGHMLVGGSTITQQVVKNFLLTNEKSFERKIKEAILAYRISNSYSKEKILELYLNEIYLGQGTYGVAAAGITYFDKSLDGLSTEEAALLAALPKAPAYFDPAKNYQRALERRNYVIGRMEEDGVFLGGLEAVALLGDRVDQDRALAALEHAARVLERLDHLFDAVAADHNHPGLFRVSRVDQHFVGHFFALGGGGRVAWRAQIAPPGDATVHLIRG